MHVIPTTSEQLTRANFKIVNYLQEQGLWRHNINVREARAVLKHSTLTVSNQVLT